MAVFVKCTSIEANLLQFFCLNTVTDEIVRHSLAYPLVQKMVRGGRPVLCENFAKLTPQKCRFPINIRS